ncbi:histone-lysine N-methyltransferase SETMAR [Trichonephila clavipes]|nr:histone-lysine N-methyltransferase SETMAR [Trichonephila clavipes]
MKRLRRLRPKYAHQGSWFLVMDIARPYTTNIVKQFLAKKKGLVQTEHPPYSPDLISLEFFILPRLKLALKRKIFDDIPIIQRNVLLLNSIPKEDFLQNFGYTTIHRTLLSEVVSIRIQESNDRLTGSHDFHSDNESSFSDIFV